MVWTLNERLNMWERKWWWANACKRNWISNRQIGMSLMKINHEVESSRIWQLYLWGMIQNVLLMALSRLVFPTPSWPTTTSLIVQLGTGSSWSELRYWRTSAARSGKSAGMLMNGLAQNEMRRSRLRADTETGSWDSLLLFTRSSSSDVSRPMSTSNSTSALSLH